MKKKKENFRAMKCKGCQCDSCFDCQSTNCDICYRAEFAGENYADMYHEVTEKKECDFE